MKAKKGTKATTEIVKSKKAEVVWNHVDYERELYKAQRIGPEKMSDEALVSFCRGVNSHFQAHYWVNVRPFFVELWRRIDVGELRMSKTEACRRIGCTPQWANAIVSGRADERRQVRAKAKEAKTRNSVSAVNGSTALLTDEEYIHKISKYAFGMLTPLLENHWERYRAICEQLAQVFDEASKTRQPAKLH
jgi:hypothetical protein